MPSPVPPRPAVARISPLARDELSPEQATLVEAIGPDSSTTNIFFTLVRHPGLFRRWLPFGGKLLTGRLPARDRELLILRIGFRCHAPYEWAQHVPIGLAVGITDDEIDRIKDGPDAPGWSAFDAALLRAADELKDDSCVSDATWAELADRYDERQLIEVPMVVGHYLLVSCTLNTLGVQIEDGVAAAATHPLAD